MILRKCFYIFILIKCHHCYQSASWRHGGQDNNYYHHRRIPQDVMVDVANNLALKLLAIHNEDNENNIAISPYGALTVLVALIEATRGEAMHEIQHAANIPADLSLIRIGLRDIHRHLKSYFIPDEGFLSGLTLSNDNVSLSNAYEDVLRFYGFDISSFNNAFYPEVFNNKTTPTTTTTTTVQETTATTSFTETERNIRSDETTTTSITSTDQSTIVASSIDNVESTAATSTDQSSIDNIVSTTNTIEATSSTDQSTIVASSIDNVESTATTIEATSSTDKSSNDNVVSTTTTNIIETTSTPIESTTTSIQAQSTVASQSTTTTMSQIDDSTTSIETASTVVAATSIDNFESTTTSMLSIVDSTTSIETTSSTSIDNVESTTTESTATTSMAPSRRRAARSVVDYIIARYYDDYHTITSRPPPYHHHPTTTTDNQLCFLINSKYTESNISFMTYDTVLPFHYIPHLKTLALRFPLDSARYYLLLLLPEDEQGIDKLICDLRLNGDLRYIINNLRYTHVRAIIPSFMLKGFVVLTPTLQKMGIRTVFEPRRADFSPMTDEAGIYVTNIEQAITVTIRNYMDPNMMLNGDKHKILQRNHPVYFKADHPFLYFVIDSEIHVTLMEGKIVNPLNSRIR